MATGKSARYQRLSCERRPPPLALQSTKKTGLSAFAAAAAA